VEVDAVDDIEDALLEVEGEAVGEDGVRRAGGAGGDHEVVGGEGVRE
jgi:hypothetical protein